MCVRPGCSQPTAYPGTALGPCARPPSCVVAAMASRLLVLAAAAASAADLNISCQIFDETMVCDGEKESVHRGEIRTCSG